MPYPTSFDSLPTNHVDPPAPGSPEKIAAAIVNNIADAINRAQTELGLNPSDLFADVATRLAALEFLNPNTITTATYTLSLADKTVGIVCTRAAGCAVTIPASSSVNFPMGTVIPVRAGTATAAASVTFAGAAGVTLVNPYSLFALVAAGAQGQLVKIGTDAWCLNGEVGP